METVSSCIPSASWFGASPGRLAPGSACPEDAADRPSGRTASPGHDRGARSSCREPPFAAVLSVLRPGPDASPPPPPFPHGAWPYGPGGRVSSRPPSRGRPRRKEGPREREGVGRARSPHVAKRAVFSWKGLAAARGPCRLADVRAGSPPAGAARGGSARSPLLPPLEAPCLPDGLSPARAKKNSGFDRFPLDDFEHF